MELQELLKFNPITIQCHDNPDADAIGSAYALYNYFIDNGKECAIIYSGRSEIQKSNLKLMIRHLEIPITYIPWEDIGKVVGGLLLTVDCQYGAGNVTRFEAENVAIIDHHQMEVTNVELSEIRSGVGSCATVVWKMLTDAGYEITDEKNVGTALYYGLFTDTNQFSELFNPIDMDAIDALPHNKTMITLFKNSNISLQELDIAGLALLRYNYNEEYSFAVVRSQPCDPNILGLISDFLLQVDSFRVCIVFSDLNGNFKFSVRSCIREVNAGELAAYLSSGIGSGGGHYEKAGGFISRKEYEEQYHDINPEAFFTNRVIAYFQSYELVYAGKYKVNTAEMKLCQKKSIPLGFCKASEFLEIGTPITVRTLEGDMDLVVEDDLYIMIGIKGEVYPIRQQKFDKSYCAINDTYVYENCVVEPTYKPTIKNRMNGKTYEITEHAHTCIAGGGARIYVRKIDSGMKVFTNWDKEKYMLGKPGDYLAAREDDLNDVYIIDAKIFDRSYEIVDGE